MNEGRRRQWNLHSHEDMNERVERAAEIGLPPRSILDNQEPDGEEGCGVVVHVQEADLQGTEESHGLSGHECINNM